MNLLSLYPQLAEAMEMAQQNLNVEFQCSGRMVKFDHDAMAQQISDALASATEQDFIDAADEYGYDTEPVVLLSHMADDLFPGEIDPDGVVSVIIA